MEYNMTRKEAEAKLEKINAEKPDWFCPEIREMCNEKCVNFQKAYLIMPDDKIVADVNSNEFEVGGRMCVNSQFTGAPVLLRCGHCGSVLTIGVGEDFGN